VKQLHDLTPTEFENLLFDLFRSSAMKNLVWRTPGPDGGRDFEAERTEYDFSGAYIIERWYVEAKRYQSSVNWPTVHEKLSYAQNANADFLLFVTTSSPSPKCTDEIDKWNSNHRIPKIRFWSKHELEFRLRLYPWLGVKYGLVDDPRTKPQILMPLVEHLAKSTIAWQESESVRSEPSRYSDLSSALATLLLVRSSDFQTAGKIIPKIAIEPDPGFSWLSLACLHDTEGFDIPALRALVCALRLKTKSSTIKCHVITPRSVELDFISKHRDVNEIDSLLSSICLFGDLELNIVSPDKVIVISRNYGT